MPSTLLANVEGGNLAKKWTVGASHLGSLLGTHTYNASPQPPNEDHQRHEQDYPSLLWCGKATINGGNCSGAWDMVCTPKWAGGLGVPDLAWLNIAMQARWPWLQCVDHDRPLKEYKITVPKSSLALFRVATRATAGDGMAILFWEGRWMNRERVEEIAPLIYAAIPQRARTSTRLSEALLTGAWVNDVRPGMGFEALQQYLMLWQRLQGFQLQQGTQTFFVGHGKGMASSRYDQHFFF